MTTFESMATLEDSSRIAIVDDDDLMRSALQGLLKAVGLPARTFASAEEFLESGQHHETTCLIADIRMSGMSGESAFRQSSSPHTATNACGCRH